MVYLPFILVSILETLLVLWFGFTLFNIRIKGYEIHMFIIASLTAHISYSLRADELSYLAPLVQIVYIIICIWGLFKIQVFYSAVVAISAYAYFSIWQSIIFFAGNAWGLFSIENVDRVPIGYIIPFLTFPIGLMSIWVVRRFNLSMDWIPSNHKQKVEWTGFNLTLTFILVAIFILYGLTIYLVSLGAYEYVVIMNILIVILYYLLFNFSKRKDRQL
ncbi:hypothetical protein PA598K_05966 [Paenibacillus sp. 598K]|uniref:hypothetical protein n=1 Tax=Paenibacillus sp. 598K TaxID=1117987 RepID=UPI000FF9715D|nr:hypothetical protein [Paenibacillus sp. 598K]GBF77414.1 hypothetical protein PA598K_05966 [Paenibacillus sp. 598K]